MMYEGIGVNGVPDATRRSCFDCAHCKAALSWWCTNPEAIKARGTKFPDIIKCPFWSPMRTEYPEPVGFWNTLFGTVDRSNFIRVDLSKNRKP